MIFSSSMKTNYTLLSICSLIIVNTASADVVTKLKNEVSPKCAQEIKQCFVESADKKNNCLNNAAAGTACDGTLFGQVIMKRWALSSTTSPEETEDSPAFTGPAFTNKECLTNFDNKLSSMLLKGIPAPSDVTALNDLLTQCEESPSDVLDNLRP
jgi:hypothetical protein